MSLPNQRLRIENRDHSRVESARANIRILHNWYWMRRAETSGPRGFPAPSGFLGTDLGASTGLDTLAIHFKE